MSEIFSLYQPDMFDWFKDGRTLPATITVGNKEYLEDSRVDGREWLTLTCNFVFAEIAENYGCDVTLSAARLEQAHRIWMDDVHRIRIDEEAEETGATPDHFKQAAHLAYWLRRRVVTNSIRPDPERGGVELQNTFVKYGNEICSFRMGFSLCLGFETRHLHEQHRQQLLSEAYLDHNFVVETAKLLHYKNVSPQSLYLIYKSLFYDLGLNIPDSTNVVPLAPRTP